MDPNETPSEQSGEHVVIVCPKCGKLIIGKSTQNAKQCPVCHHRFLVAGRNVVVTTFARPSDATRFIAAEEAKRAGRLDFHAVQSFGPVTAKEKVVAPRTRKVVGGTTSPRAEFLTWARGFFAASGGDPDRGLPAMQVVAEATKAGFTGAGDLVEQALADGSLVRPKPYTLWVRS